ncbi:YIEGIA family protein [Desulfolucanica intricata]|uniref:YIEGIA family protein n=1 Tax=Desulfolucanica intricata TaxID=1285191 RepID=UPI0008295635|nr:YIEGIA family protein [Desulfolucanica intricata]
MQDYLVTILLGIITGTLSRVVLLRLDYRMYPGYPHGYISHVALGFIASALGAVAVPAILKPDYAAVTFLALAAQQFRDIRSMERKTLESLEKTELVKRGNDYIEGISRTFEARNFLVMGTAFFTSLIYAFTSFFAAVIAGGLLIMLSWKFGSDKTIGDICTVEPAEVSFKNTVLMIDDISVMTVGLKEIRKKILQDALGVIIKPKSDYAWATIHDVGQRQAIAHTSAVLLGSKKDIDIPEFTPLARKDPDTGKVGLYIVPVQKDINLLIEAVKKCPVLETAKSRPISRGPAGQK